jgi:hypothetical protein
MREDGDYRVNPERRQYPRKKLPALEYVELGPDNGGYFTDLSEGGLAVQVVRPLASGERINFWFVLGENVIETGGRIAWADDAGKAAGVEFLRMSENSQQQIREWLSRDRAAGPIGGEIEDRSRAEAPASAEPPLALLESAKGVPPLVLDLMQGPQPSQPPGSQSPLSPENKPSEQTERPPPKIFRQTLIPTTIPRFGIEDTPSAQEREAEANDRSADEEPAVVEGERRTFGFVGIAALLGLAALVAGLILSSSFREALGGGLIKIGLLIGGAMPSSPAPTPALVTPPQQSQKAQADRTVDRGEATRPAPPPTQPAASVETSPSPGAAAQESAGSSRSAPLADTPENDAALDVAIGNSYLTGHGRPQNSSEAARWFWAGVERGSTAAEVALADLYLRGDGVPQSCEEARVLLTAAAKRGSEAATSKLGTLGAGVCR